MFVFLGSRSSTGITCGGAHGSSTDPFDRVQSYPKSEATRALFSACECSYIPGTWYHSLLPTFG